MTTISPRQVREAMEGAVGAQSVSEGVAGYVVDGLQPKAVVLPNSVQELSQAMAAAWEGDMAVAPWGGGTRVELGNTITHLDVVADLSRLNQVLNYNSADLTSTVQAGISLASLQRTLAEQGQFLALSPPLPDRASVGGTLAAGVSGPLQWQYGNPRDLVIGMKVVQADGKVIKSGGQVVKNVSGYDMTRLHIGAIGSLGIIAEVSFKLTPLPPKETTLLAGFDSNEPCLKAGLGIFHSDAMPLALTAFDSGVDERAEVAGIAGANFLAVRLGGRPLTLERQLGDCSSILTEHGAMTVETLDGSRAETLWRKVADFGWDESTKPLMTARAHVLPTEISELTAVLGRSGSSGALYPAIVSHPGYGNITVNWFAQTEDVSTDLADDALSQAQDAVHSLGGRMVIERCPLDVKSRLDVWDEPGEPLAIMRRMKEQYDPKGILNPGRFVGGT